MAGYQRHHLMFERRSFETASEKAIRNHSSLIQPINHFNHRLLHLMVPGIAPPSPLLSETIMERLESYPAQEYEYEHAIKLKDDLKAFSSVMAGKLAVESMAYNKFLENQLVYALMEPDLSEYILRKK